MVARKKVVLMGASPQDGSLRTRVSRAIATTQARNAATKDMHLVEAALATDGIVASLDENAHAAFHEATTAVRELATLVWVNPDSQHATTTRWLEDGARPEPGLLL